jgi:hypothetical protein
MDDFLHDDEGKLGQGFTSADELEQADIGNGSCGRTARITPAQIRKSPFKGFNVLQTV